MIFLLKELDLYSFWIILHPLKLIPTMLNSLSKGLLKHVLTEKGIEGFLADWEKTGQSIPTS